jgi:hypothetical protein
MRESCPEKSRLRELSNSLDVLLKTRVSSALLASRPNSSWNRPKEVDAKRFDFSLPLLN